MPVEIKLKNGEVTLVDQEDVLLLAGRAWRVHKRRLDNYVHGVVAGNGDTGLVHMHRLIMDAPNGMFVDHIDGNPLNNTRSNLRICSKAENGRNRGKQKNNTSGFKGVFPSKSRKRWRAQIYVNGNRHALGSYATAAEAHSAYCVAAKHMHGEFARF